MPNETMAHIIDDLAEATRLVTALTDALIKGIVELRARYESHAVMTAIGDEFIGPGHYIGNADLLTPQQMLDIAAAVNRGDLVQVLLYADQWKPGSRIARVIKVNGTMFEVALWGNDEQKQKFYLVDARKEIWGWYIAAKASGV